MRLHWEQKAVKPLVFLLCLIPFAFLVWKIQNNNLGPNPAEHLIHSTGIWTLRFLCITLAVTPLRQALSWASLARFRRMFGLFTFFYALLHAFSYAWLDMEFSGIELLKDIAKRPFILVGFSTLLIFVPLAATSNNAVIRWMGAKRWKNLHRSVYAAALLALLHFYWMKAGKNNFEEVKIYATIIGLLLLWRVLYSVRQRRKSRKSRVT